MRLSAILAIAVALLVVTVNAADLLFLDFFGATIVLPYALGTFAGVGLVVALRRPSHPIGWLFLAAAACFALNFTSRAYAWRALVDAPSVFPGGEVALLLATVVGPLSNGALPVLALIFPTGRLPWRRGAGAVIVAIAAGLIATTVARTFAPTGLRVPYSLGAPPPPDQMNLLPTIPNPAAINGPLGEWLAALVPVLDATLLPFVAVCVLGFVVRFVRSSGIERLQLKWFVYPTGLSLSSLVIAGTLHTGTVAGIAWIFSQVFLGLIPVAVGIAILRYRLYDIDVLINRTVVYGATTAAIGATFFLGLVALQPALRPITNGSDLAVAAATLLSFALFQPVRRVVQNAVDRRFDRSRYDAARTLDSFADRLRDEVDLDALRGELLHAVRSTMGPAHASLWLREPAR